MNWIAPIYTNMSVHFSNYHLMRTFYVLHILYRLFTTQTFDFPGSNLLATQQPEQLTRSLICLKTCQWVSITYRIKSCIWVLQNLPLPIDAVTPALLFASDTLSFFFVHAFFVVSTIISPSTLFSLPSLLLLALENQMLSLLGSFPWAFLYLPHLLQAGSYTLPLGFPQPPMLFSIKTLIMLGFNYWLNLFLSGA